MPPKAADAVIAEVTKDTTFLATCFMNMKTKPVVDTTAVAAKLSMSVGGVRNKLRPIIKAMEDGGALWTTDHPTVLNQGGGSQEKVHAAESVKPKPKAKSPRKSPAKINKSSGKHSHKVEDSEVDGEETITENAPQKKRAKLSPSCATGDQNEQFKTENEADSGIHERLEHISEVDKTL